MAVRFALRSRIVLRELPERKAERKVPPFALPVALYWAVIGFCIYGVQTRSFHVERWFSDETPVARAASYPDRAFQIAAAAPAPAPAPVAAVDQPEPVPALSTRSAPSFAPLGSPIATKAPDPRLPFGARSNLRTPRNEPPPPRSEPRPTTTRVLLRVDSRPISLDSDLLPFGEMSGPIDSVSLPRNAPSEPNPKARVAPVAPPPSSCEAAVARAHQDVDLTGPRGTPDVTRDAYASILDDGAYLSSCDVPDDTRLELCVAVEHGHAVGITVTSNPSNARVTACVRRAVSALAFPESDRMDVARTRFDRVPR